MNEKIIKEEFHRRTSYYKNVTVPFLFQGQYNDYETELAYNRFRYYSPAMGCYISQDPIGLLGGFRLYDYVKNTNTWIDVLGLFPVEKLADLSVRTKSSYQGATIYKITKKVELDGVKFQKGDYYYLDNLHKDHIETFSKNDVSKGVFNLYGTYNDRKSEKAKKEKNLDIEGRTISPVKAVKIIHSNASLEEVSFLFKLSYKHRFNKKKFQDVLRSLKVLCACDIKELCGIEINGLLKDIFQINRISLILAVSFFNKADRYVVCNIKEHDLLDYISEIDDAIFLLFNRLSDVRNLPNKLNI